jgi:hypothetical protein
VLSFAGMRAPSRHEFLLMSRSPLAQATRDAYVAAASTYTKSLYE